MCVKLIDLKHELETWKHWQYWWLLNSSLRPEKQNTVERGRWILTKWVNGPCMYNAVFVYIQYIYTNMAKLYQLWRWPEFDPPASTPYEAWRVNNCIYMYPTVEPACCIPSTSKPVGAPAPTSILWRPGYTPGWRSNQLGVLWHPCTALVYKLLCTSCCASFHNMKYFTHPLNCHIFRKIANKYRSEASSHLVFGYGMCGNKP